MRNHWLQPLVIALVLVIAIGSIAKTAQGCTEDGWCIVFEMIAGAAITVTIGGLAASAVHLFYRVPKYSYQEHILHELAVMRTDGVKLRNDRPDSDFSKEETKQWFMTWDESIEKWYDDLYDKAYEFSPVEAERLKTLDTYPQHPFREKMTPQQDRTISMLTEKLKRLDTMLEKRFRPTPSP